MGRQILLFAYAASESEVWTYFALVAECRRLVLLRGLSLYSKKLPHFTAKWGNLDSGLVAEQCYGSPRNLTITFTWLRVRYFVFSL